ncbi:MAG: chromosome partitioning protein ParB [Bacteroides sp.]|nr:chromosome partitioning protein ParB [Bacteroides sp.]
MENLQYDLYATPVKAKPKKSEQTYEEFVEKFKPKKTTDDCYTPPHIYDCIKKWVNDNVCPLEGVEIVRPFYPGGDYRNAEYPAGCIVLDNPPFSILAQIRAFYAERGVRFFLFAPHLTLFSTLKADNECFIVASATIVYENGAAVKTGFITNLRPDTRVWVAGDLNKAIDKADKDYRNTLDKVSLPIYDYPGCVITAARLGKIVERNISLKFDKDSTYCIHELDEQKAAGKTIFGGGFLLSERAAAECAAAECAAAECAAAECAAQKEKIIWELSERELAIQKTLR